MSKCDFEGDLRCRLLDDNRELYVPELGEMVKPHPHFMLFATQNPAGAYGGRKVPSPVFVTAVAVPAKADSCYILMIHFPANRE